MESFVSDIAIFIGGAVAALTILSGYTARFVLRRVAHKSEDFSNMKVILGEETIDINLKNPERVEIDKLNRVIEILKVQRNAHNYVART